MASHTAASRLALKTLAEEVLPRSLSDLTSMASEGVSKGRRMELTLADFTREHFAEEQSLTQLYEAVDRLRVTAKDVQNYVDRALASTHAFVPMIEGSYSCAGSDDALSHAHNLHLLIGRAKEAIGGGAGGDLPPTPGAADLLAQTERKLGEITNNAPEGLQPALEVKDGKVQEALEASFDPWLLAACACRQLMAASRPRQTKLRAAGSLMAFL
eukprot:TRINITY_DN36339_c0_g1_i1.p1 TRINITY_DN36339_c0_g1~~TRINITY_DN36339_c0_g1_i1.p1  ORF type:complete len:214 (-),score=41.47 TRINITY_DN36339_c0_g1_i1:17-658(-)